MHIMISGHLRFEADLPSAPYTTSLKREEATLSPGTFEESSYFRDPSLEREAAWDKLFKRTVLAS